MKKFPAIILFALLLTGCAEKTAVPEPESIAVPETTTETEVPTTEPITTAPQIETAKPNVLSEYENYFEVVHSDMNFHNLCEPPYLVCHLENEDIYYKKYADNLNYVGRITAYTGDDGLEYTDTYFQSETGEQLICRTQTDSDTEIFVHPFQCFFTVKINGINIYLRETNELIQTIETDYRVREDPVGHCTPPVHYVSFSDMDGDGYDDIYIDDGEGAGNYFRFNPETFRFDEV
ncbi:MAG: hypothetical protein NC340_08035 [Ruminococcus flavefaciens]|nr:hypothetical protein [Ruminococcus flavefaciens]MCM1229927.1 hypothetical protein [Ruminococcus flavefaciens]